MLSFDSKLFAWLCFNYLSWMCLSFIILFLIAGLKPGSNLGRCRTPQKWTFWTQKVDFLNLTPLNPPKNPTFDPLCGLKWTFCQIWGCIEPPGYRPVWLWLWWLWFLLYCMYLLVSKLSACLYISITLDEQIH